MKSNRKQVIRLTESDLHRIVENSVKKILRENTQRYSVYVDGETAYSTNDLEDAYNYSEYCLSKYGNDVSIWDNYEDEEVDYCG